MGFGANVAVKKVPSFFGPAYLAVWNAVVSFLSFEYDCYSHITIFSGESCLLLSFPFLFV